MQRAMTEEQSEISEITEEFKDSELAPENADPAEQKYAIIDDASMADFDKMVPVETRAIVYPFEMDDFQKRAVYRLE